MRESVVERYLVNQVKVRGGLIRKIRYVGRNACPDRLVGFPNGRTAMVELKRLDEHARAEQEREHTRLRAVGFDVRVINSLDQVDDFVAEMTGG